jgi:arsenate reductase
VTEGLAGEAARLHWGLPDPAAAGGSEEERPAAFRETRDELRRRIARLFGRLESEREVPT